MVAKGDIWDDSGHYLHVTNSGDPGKPGILLYLILQKSQVTVQVSLCVVAAIYQVFGGSAHVEAKTSSICAAKC